MGFANLVAVTVGFNQIQKLLHHLVVQHGKFTKNH